MSSSVVQDPNLAGTKSGRLLAMQPTGYSTDWLSDWLQMPPGAREGAGHAHDRPARSGLSHILALIQCIGVKDLTETDWLELFFYLSSRRSDARNIAEEAISQYGSLGKFMQRPAAELQRSLGVDQEETAFIVLIKNCIKIILSEQIPESLTLNSYTKIKDYFVLDFRHAEQEILRVLYLDHKNRLMVDEEMARGTVDAVPIYPTQIARKALACGASGVVMAHNHLSNDPNPTKEDIEATILTRHALEVLDIALHDHIIVAQNHCLSMRERNYL